MNDGNTTFTYTFCLESKIRHSTITGVNTPVLPTFCLESKIRHSTIIVRAQDGYGRFALNPK